MQAKYNDLLQDETELKDVVDIEKHKAGDRKAQLPEIQD